MQDFAGAKILEKKSANNGTYCSNPPEHFSAFLLRRRLQEKCRSNTVFCRVSYKRLVYWPILLAFCWRRMLFCRSIFFWTDGLVKKRLFLRSCKTPFFLSFAEKRRRAFSNGSSDLISTLKLLIGDSLAKFWNLLLSFIRGYQYITANIKS